MCLLIKRPWCIGSQVLMILRPMSYSSASVLMIGDATDRAVKPSARATSS